MGAVPFNADQFFGSVPTGSMPTQAASGGAGASSSNQAAAPGAGGASVPNAGGAAPGASYGGSPQGMALAPVQS